MFEYTIASSDIIRDEGNEIVISSRQKAIIRYKRWNVKIEEGKKSSAIILFHIIDLTNYKTHPGVLYKLES